MDWTKWKEMGSFEKMGVGKMRATPRTYAWLCCPLCGDDKAMVVLKERLVSLRPRVVRDHLRVCEAVEEGERCRFVRNTVQQKRKEEMKPRKKTKAERTAAKQERKAVAAAHKSVAAKVKGKGEGVSA